MFKNQNNAANNPQFDYKYHQQGQDWTGDALGVEQSPIDINTLQATNPSSKMQLEFTLSNKTLTDLQFLDSGNALLLSGPFSTLRATDINGDLYDYEAVQFHFHAPAEHTINGGQYELELHIVHKMTEESAARAKTLRKLAVVGVFFKLDANAEDNAFIDALKLDNVEQTIDLNMHKLLGGQLRDMTTFYAYKGSLTTPPCSELVNWYLFETPLKVTRSQLDLFDLRWRSNMEFADGFGNNRPVQGLNGRAVLKSKNCCVLASTEHPDTSVFQENTEKIANNDLSMRRNRSDKVLINNIDLGSSEEFVESPRRRTGNMSNRILRQKSLQSEDDDKNSSTPTLGRSTIKKSTYSKASSFMNEKEAKTSQATAEQS